ncbi:hypothetical protein C8R44DRAFT_778533 [Mycena epipterygia]|nr:hypothetical protein C8R44DRAFT_778533 [Mycena epipterygia]
MPSIQPTPPLLKFRLPLQTPMPAVEELGQAQRALTPGISSAIPPRPASVRVKISRNARTKGLYNILT